MDNMYNKIPYVLVFRGESFRFNNKKGDRRTINDPTEQINALKSVKKNVVDHWSHKYKLDHVIASTYSTKFDNLLTGDNTVLLVIDWQPDLIDIVHNIDKDVMVNNKIKLTIATGILIFFYRKIYLKKIVKNTIFH